MPPCFIVQVYHLALRSFVSCTIAVQTQWATVSLSTSASFVFCNESRNFMDRAYYIEFFPRWEVRQHWMLWYEQWRMGSNNIHIAYRPFTWWSAEHLLRVKQCCEKTLHWFVHYCSRTQSLCRVMWPVHVKTQRNIQITYMSFTLWSAKQFSAAKRHCAGSCIIAHNLEICISTLTEIKINKVVQYIIQHV